MLYLMMFSLGFCWLKYTHFRRSIVFSFTIVLVHGKHEVCMTVYNIRMNENLALNIFPPVHRKIIVFNLKISTTNEKIYCI